MVDVRKYSNDPRKFFNDLRIPGANGQRRFGDIMAPFQAERFAALTPALLAVAKGTKPAIGRFWWEATKGASKDSDLASALAWLLFFSPRMLTMQVGAADQSQADELRKAMKSLVACNPWLESRLLLQGSKIVQRETQSTCEILSADVAGSHGARPDVLIANELSHVSKRDFMANLLDNASKVPGGLAVIATNAGHENTWQAEWRDIAKTSDRWSFHRFAEPAPWLDPQEIAEAERRNPHKRFRRLWWGEWSDTADESALDAADIARCVRLAGELQPERGYSYIGSADLGIVHDAAAVVVLAKSVGWTETVPRPRAPVSRLAEVLADVGEIERPNDEPEYITHPGDGRLQVAAIRCWRPRPGKRVDLAAVEREIFALHERYCFSRCGADPWQAEHMVQNLQRRGVPIETVSFSSAENQQSMASSILDAVRENNIDLPDDQALLADLKALRLLDKGTRFRLVASRTNSDGAGTPHGDLAIALSIATHVAKGIRTAESRVAYGGAPLLVWP
jgi:phage terminase large subunit-like protein